MINKICLFSFFRENDSLCFLTNPLPPCSASGTRPSPAGLRPCRPCGTLSSFTSAPSKSLVYTLSDPRTLLSPCWCKDRHHTRVWSSRALVGMCVRVCGRHHTRGLFLYVHSILVRSHTRFLLHIQTSLPLGFPRNPFLGP